MRLGILADIHEHLELMRDAIRVLEDQDVDRIILLGDIAYDGQHVAETVQPLLPLQPLGVWGNHDLGLAYQPTPRMRERYGQTCIDFFTGLAPHVEMRQCLFAHGMPSWDATDPSIYYTGTPPWEDGALESEFASFPHAWIIVGHYHRWFAADVEGRIPWDGASTLHREDGQRLFIIVDALFQGSFAILDTEKDLLTPYSLS